MKKALFIITIVSSGFFCSPVFSQNKTIKVDSLGLPGDNLNLYSVLSIFQGSATLEEFEKKLNDKDGHVNNLDLNNDNKIDYLKVVDNVKGTAHAIVLQDAVNDKETQDVAVIEVDKDQNDKVQIQIVGDESLYGKDYIVEPNDSTSKDGTPNPAYNGQSSDGSTSPTVVNNTTNNYYNNDPDYGYAYAPSSWMIVHYMYGPSYIGYVSPWSWGFYPSYWSPWTPWFFHAYYGHWYHYHGYGYWHRAYTYRSMGAHNYYGQRRSASTTVYQHREAGDYRKTYSRPDLTRSERKPRQSTGARSTTSGARNNSSNNSGNQKPRSSNSNSQSKGNYSKPVQRQQSTSQSQGQSQPQSQPRNNNVQRSAPATRSSGGGGGHSNGGGGGARSSGGGGGGHSSGGGGGGHKGR